MSVRRVAGLLWHEQSAFSVGLGARESVGPAERATVPPRSVHEGPAAVHADQAEDEKAAKVDRAGVAYR